ncbi:MAG: hypothetical protein A3E37_03290 [Candidatus Andersenbacteria bacterium RIFCSPHIGHO2_12_FULL_46_9]|nr:MAG: hypothetical protein UW94_C0003G0021 [Parcubacteria group bacterium GW2011_GWA2_45_14]OGY33822.1 MAG: hypothetical protein A3B76_03085 [Candidatus Andersenbacteria bacterium RIFCSPHIGHO2_02_FULL_46_16]OGY35383.1 MAG: hypothetical protein A3E37_03290 [Candidatus Andersenbacteria bacterium RIFCSPHIGHO2_12_FULL_46_9]OGY36257.1 MAG: hypothetical protein A3I08_05405 [Candidatus Andersenbacteria bacterium RIFCSPLOWO2_02_FULL_46_11]
MNTIRAISSGNRGNEQKLAAKKPVRIVWGVVFLTVVLRLYGVGSFMTVDEELWMTRSGEFYHKLLEKNDPGGTFTTTHPGATTQWLAGAGIYAQEKRMGTGVDTSNLAAFRMASTWPMVLGVSLLIGLITYLVTRLMGSFVGTWAGVLLAVEPYLVGMSQIVHVDMLLALFMLSAMLGLLIFTENLKWRWLVIAGIMTGFAWGTKLLPGLWLLLVSAGIIKGQYGWFVPAIRHIDWRILGEQIKTVSRQFLFYVGIAVLTFYLVWPALWVKTNLADYYARDVVSVATQEHVTLEQSEEPIEALGFYVRVVLGRTSPFVLLIGLGMIVGWIRFYGQELIWRHVVGRLGRHDGVKGSDSVVFIRVLGWLIAYIIGYLVVISLMAKKADRYALPALVVLPVLAALGLSVADQAIKKTIATWQKIMWRRTVMGLVVVALLIQVVGWIPYSIAYNSPMFDIRALSSQGWGEGLDAAALWLNERTLGNRLTVASWYPGVMRTYFQGKTMSLSSRHDDRVGYVVTYRNMYGRGEDELASNVLKELADKVPEHVIRITGKEYVWIYNVIGLKYFTNNTGELYGDMEVGQLITAPANWQSIEIGLANFSGRNNTQDVMLHIRKDINDNTDIRTMKVAADQIEDMEWHRFDFASLNNSDGEEYFISLTSPMAKPGDAITVLFSPVDILVGQMAWRHEALGERASNSQFRREGYDIAYRFTQSQ